MKARENTESLYSDDASQTQSARTSQGRETNKENQQGKKCLCEVESSKRIRTHILSRSFAAP